MGTEHLALLYLEWFDGAAAIMPSLTFPEAVCVCGLCVCVDVYNVSIFCPTPS